MANAPVVPGDIPSSLLTPAEPVEIPDRGNPAAPVTPPAHPVPTEESASLQPIQQSEPAVSDKSLRETISNAESPSPMERCTPSTQSPTADDGESTRVWTSTQKALMARQNEMAKNTSGYMESVVANFRKIHQGEVIKGRGSKTVGIAITGKSGLSEVNNLRLNLFRQ